MKTSIKNILLALSLAALSSSRAEEFIYVDIDGDGYADAVPLNETAGKQGAKICGGADDDQIVGGDGADFVKPVLPNTVTNGTPFASGNTPIGVPSNPSLPAGIMGAGIGGGPNLSPDPAQWPTIIVTSPGDGGILTSAPMSGIILTNPGDGGILTSKPVNGIVITNPGEGGVLTDHQIDLLINTTLIGPICGGNGNDSIHQGVIVGGTGIDYLRPAAAHPLTGDAGEDVIDAMLLELMSTGRLNGDEDADTLWGGGGTDEVVVPNPSGTSI